MVALLFPIARQTHEGSFHYGTWTGMRAEAPYCACSAGRDAGDELKRSPVQVMESPTRLPQCKVHSPSCIRIRPGTYAVQGPAAAVPGFNPMDTSFPQAPLCIYPVPV